MQPNDAVAVCTEEFEMLRARIGQFADKQLSTRSERIENVRECMEYLIENMEILCKKPHNFHTERLARTIKWKLYEFVQHSDVVESVRQWNQQFEVYWNTYGLSQALAPLQRQP